MDKDLSEIFSGLAEGRIIPYLGPGLLPEAGATLPSGMPALAEVLSGQVTVPHKVRRNLTGAAQYIENFKHRKTLVGMMDKTFAGDPPIHPLQRDLAARKLPLIVHLWYDNGMAKALAEQGTRWGRIQGLSQTEHYGHWTGYMDAEGQPVEAAVAAQWDTILYEPWGSQSPANNYLVSDTDFVEVLTEIDIQTPIPEIVQQIRTGRHFLFVGCRFNDQLQRNFARQIMKRSSDRHWALIEAPLTRNEARFVREQGIQVLQMPSGVLLGEAAVAKAG